MEMVGGNRLCPWVVGEQGRKSLYTAIFAHFFDMTPLNRKGDTVLVAILCETAESQDNHT